MSIRNLLRAVTPAPVRRMLRRMVSRTKPSGQHWCRVVMDKECDKFVSLLPIAEMSCLEISGPCSRWSRLAWKRYESVQYPEYDLCSGPRSEKAWDIIIAEQVLEHVPNPARALKNIQLMLRPGGIAILTTPFLVKFHPDPKDYYRWTADGLREAILQAGFSSVDTHTWGNRDCLLADMTDDGAWVFYRPRQHSLENQPRFPIVVWAFARR